MSDNFRQFHEEVYKSDPAPEGAHGWIQWKGTDVCMDIHCTCGAHLHADDEFLYYIRCLSCGQSYAVGQHVRLIPLTQEQIELGGIGDNIIELSEDE